MLLLQQAIRQWQVVQQEETMKFTRNTMIIVALAVTLIAAVAVSQTVANGHRHGMGFGFDEHMLNFMTEQLELTEAQQAQIKDILAKEKPAMQLKMDQLRQAHNDLMKLETSSNFSEAAVREFVAQHAPAATDLIVERARVHNEIFQVLTPEQKTKALDLMNRHQQHIMNHMHQAPSGGGI
jgi:Spy/CpxP family protein refolding chaperone